MRDRLNTRRLLARIDRSEDPYVIFDRIRQLLYDMEDRQERTDARVHALEEEKRNFVTDTGLTRKLDAHEDKKTAHSIRVLGKLSLGEVLKVLITIGIGSGITFAITRCGH